VENTKQQVREFYDEIGWMADAAGLYQNARYEDMRPVSREYIHRCHLRVNRYIAPSGRFLLDAGSGPVQWSEYLTYSQGYSFRVCTDISMAAMKAARERLREHGLYVIGDIANLPFPADVFDGIVSIHAIHHLPLSEHKQAYLELNRVLKPERSAAAINGWYRPPLMRAAEPLIRLGRWISGRGQKRKKEWSLEDEPAGTFVQKMTPAWLRQELAGSLKIQIYAWRSLSPRFMRWFIRPQLGGAVLLRVVFWLEDRFPGFFGENGQYPLVVIRKP
jgi:ubiquinone/menaquinone biosynthesis C-methylase UbiE